MPQYNTHTWKSLIWSGSALVCTSVPLALSPVWQTFFVALSGGIALIVSGIFVRANTNHDTQHQKTTIRKSIQGGLLFTILFSLFVFIGMSVVVVLLALR